MPAFSNVPTEFEALKTWLKDRPSIYGKDRFIEGIVWHCENGDMYKIKVNEDLIFEMSRENCLGPILYLNEP